MADSSHLVCDNLVELLDLETLDSNLFRGRIYDVGAPHVFGGQVLSQALVAAKRTVEEQVVHSLHGYFLRSGDKQAPIVYEVDRIRDGRSFNARRIQAIQHGRPIFSMMASFHTPEVGSEHAAPMPVVPPPEELISQKALHKDWVAQATEVPEWLQAAMTQTLPIEFRQVQPWNQLDPDKREPAQCIWFRAVEPLPDDAALHRTVMAYASDFELLTTAMLPHGVSAMQQDMIAASLDHAIWFHRTPVADDWLLYVMDSPAAQNARGLSRGLIYDRAGHLMATVSQESLMRTINAG